MSETCYAKWYNKLVENQVTIFFDLFEDICNNIKTIINRKNKANKISYKS